MSEKRYFKVFAERHTIGEQNKYLVLFDTIVSLSVDDDSLLRQKLNEKGLQTNFISADKNYLYSLLLRCLNDFHYAKTINLTIKEGLNSIELLFHKGLYSDALYLIEKHEKQALECENFALMLDILNWKKKCVGYSLGVFRAQDINNQMDDSLSKLNNLKQITNLYYESYILRFKEGKTELPKVKFLFEQLLSHELLASADRALSLIGKIYYYLIYAHYYYVIDDIEREYDVLFKCIQLAKNSSWYCYENPIDYISIYNRILPLKKYIHPHTFYDDIAHLRNFADSVTMQKDLIQQRIFIHTYTNELEYLFFHNKIEQALKIIPEVEEGMSHLSKPIEVFYMVQLYNLFATIYLMSKDFDKSIKYINIILNNHKKEISDNNFIRVEILNLMIHFEMKNYYLVNTLAKAILKKHKEDGLYPLERSLVKVLFQLTRTQLPTVQMIEKEIGKLSKQYEETQKNVLKKNFLEEVYYRWMIRL